MTTETKALGFTRHSLSNTLREYDRVGTPILLAGIAEAVLKREDALTALYEALRAAKKWMDTQPLDASIYAQTLNALARAEAL